MRPQTGLLCASSSPPPPHQTVHLLPLSDTATAQEAQWSRNEWTQMAAELPLWSTRRRHSALGVTLISAHMNHSELIRVLVNTSVASVHFLKVGVVKMAKIFNGGEMGCIYKSERSRSCVQFFLCHSGRKIILEGVVYVAVLGVLTMYFLDVFSGFVTWMRQGFTIKIHILSQLSITLPFKITFHLCGTVSCFSQLEKSSVFLSSRVAENKHFHSANRKSDSKGALFSHQTTSGIQEKVNFSSVVVSIRWRIINRSGWTAQRLCYS